ncbi:MAG: HD domain protein [Candidatus Argoarchaeum ethanivorans]|uniref:HD domain protein n=1 Tax=Candidatus Argoarchaeum ethanivorans TaxID=2608793 RepID=A0A811T110_9EURY|nr:MAG: HD domain protein [Candidatus Argoarchaeum ethanivorans]
MIEYNADTVFFHSWFRNYVKSFYTKDPKTQENIRLKEEHTLRVCKEILQLGKALNLNNDALRLAEIIALFHDIGRFEQFTIYGTFNDRVSENHATLGLKVLKVTNILCQLTKAEQTIICNAVKYHNARKVPNSVDKLSGLHSKLIRDADKLDIWHVVTTYYTERHRHRNPALELELPDTPGYSRSFIDDILNNRVSNSHDLKTFNDMKLLQLGWIFDINFAPTFFHIRERRIIEKIITALPDTEDIRKIQNHLKAYLEKRVSGKSGNSGFSTMQ